jgi:hypothetical protein
MRWDISEFIMPFDMVESLFGRWTLSSFEVDLERAVGRGSGFLTGAGLLPPPLLIVA